MFFDKVSRKFPFNADFQLFLSFWGFWWGVLEGSNAKKVYLSYNNWYDRIRWHCVGQYFLYEFWPGWQLRTLFSVTFWDQYFLISIRYKLCSIWQVWTLVHCDTFIPCIESQMNYIYCFFIVTITILATCDATKGAWNVVYKWLYCRLMIWFWDFFLRSQ